MSPLEPAPLPQPPLVLPSLTANERRVLGVLVEKAKTTPDAYPLSLNGLTTGCNQKSNRHPVLELSDMEVEEALAGCQKHNLALRITGGGRVERWKHNLYDAWQVEKVELAVLAELLLRGPQTLGELRARASRMEPIADLDALRGVMQALAERSLVVYLTAEGRRGAMVTHGFHSANELERLRARHPSDFAVDNERVSVAVQPAAPANGPMPPAPPQPQEIQIAALQMQHAALHAQIVELQSAVANLTSQLQSLKSALGA